MQSEGWDLLYKSAFESVLLPCGRIVRSAFPEGDPVLTELAEHARGLNLVDIGAHSEHLRLLFVAQAYSVFGG